MTFNYAEEKRKFEAQWEKTSKFYAEQGMSPESIAQMREYDWNWFKAQRIEALHTQELISPENYHNGEAVRPENFLLERYMDSLTCEYDALGGHSRYWWIEELSSPRLVSALPKLTERDKNILTMYFVEGYSQAECASILHIDQSTFSRYLSTALSIFTEK